MISIAVHFILVEPRNLTVKVTPNIPGNSYKIFRNHLLSMLLAYIRFAEDRNLKNHLTHTINILGHPIQSD